MLKVEILKYMKAKNILLLAALTLGFLACEKQAPFDTQSENDYPLILKPYNESGTGSFIYTLSSASTPLVDSVVVTPSRYTTVNWIVNDSVVHTGTKIEKTFAKGIHDLVIEAVTTKGKRTERSGLIIVEPHELWNGPHDLAWDESIKVTKAEMAGVPVGATIMLFFEALADQEYYALRITTPWWGDDLLPQMDGVKDLPSPFSITYDEHCKALVEETGAFIVVGNGLKIKQIICDK
jgi:hypothetical protein